MTLTKQEQRTLRDISAKLDPAQTPKPPTQGDYIEDVPLLLSMVRAAHFEIANLRAQLAQYKRPLIPR